MFSLHKRLNPPNILLSIIGSLLLAGCMSPRRQPIVVTPPTTEQPSPSTPPDCLEENGERWDGTSCKKNTFSPPQTEMTNAECLAAKYNWVGGKCLKPMAKVESQPSMCNMKNLKICLAYGQPGEDCYTKNLCRQDQDIPTYSCNIEALNICIAYQGGKACYPKYDCDPKL